MTTTTLTFLRFPEDRPRAACCVCRDERNLSYRLEDDHGDEDFACGGCMPQLESASELGMLPDVNAARGLLRDGSPYRQIQRGARIAATA